MTKKTDWEIRAEAIAFGEVLYERYPKAFIHPRLRGKGMRPLKVGIDEDLKAAFPDITKRVISAFLTRYSSSAAYRRCGTMVGTYRVDMEGEAIAVVNPDHARYAATKLGRMPSTGDGPATPGLCDFSGKRTFGSLDEATAAGRNVLRRTAQTKLTVYGYRCEHCGGFHWSNEEAVSPTKKS